nr:uncharacterized protein LOC110382564 [Helicoverpa armigera]XP_049707678.1 uncharacterized protein LOC110382564 [Helicoverpa armigera]
MALLTPVTLSGDNLGQRHRHLNNLVREAHESGAKFPDVEALPELSPLDRLLKIDLAVKLQHVHYIIHNLKHDDMLYVSRALRATWLVHHQDIINPKHLEDVLFPEMLAPAVTRMKHWLYINLREPAMCQQFYQHYKPDSFDYAIKFLNHCSQDFILEEVPNILAKISCHYLKVLCEKCPRVAKIYFDALATDDDVKARYLAQEKVYYNSVKCVLKSDADVFLDITEKYFNMNSFSRLSPSATDYIVRCHKARLWSKLELYTAHILHIPSLAARLSVEECQEVVLQLARASYLQHWFSYKAVEPLIKRLSPDKRAAFKKRVFVEKDVGEPVPDWPYSTPDPPPQTDSDPYVFDDEEFSTVCGIKVTKRLIKKRRGYDDYVEIVSCENIDKVKTDLDRLFEEFRFIGFDRALHELGQRLQAASSVERRRDIFLVLVSKTGGRSEAVSALLRLAARHSNEPPHIRASILRSLVKRANVWRLPADVWQHLLEFGHGLGLDGEPPEAACREGLHAVVIRQLLAGECEQAIRVAFLNDFSTLTEYSLKKDERERVAVGLQNMLAASAADAEPSEAAERLGQTLDIIFNYGIGVHAALPTVMAVKSLALRDAEVSRYLLRRLYDARIGRRELLRENLKFRCDQAAFLNALRHDPAALEVETIADEVALGGSRFDVLISKLVVYFNHDKDDITGRLSHVFQERVSKRPENRRKIIKKTNVYRRRPKNVNLTRALASLLCRQFGEVLSESDTEGSSYATYGAALRACAHRARPAVNLAEWGWRKAGVKAVATLAMRCREAERASLTRALAAERRTVRVALALSMRSAGGAVLDTFAAAVKLRPAVALRVALLYFRRFGASADKVWELVKPLFSTVDLGPRERLRESLRNAGWRSTIAADYWATVYLALHKIPNSKSLFILRSVCSLLPEIRQDTLENVLLCMFNTTEDDIPVIPFPALYVRYLMLARSDQDFEERFSKIGNQFFEILENLRREEASAFERRLHQILACLKYNAAFMDTDYTCCLLVIEKVLAWIQTFKPKQEFFDTYVQVHLTMLYYRAVRQSMKQMPDVFADVKRRKSEGVEAVGFVLGRYIVKEVAQLVETYFDSIIELYSSALGGYFDQFSCGKSRSKFIGAVLRGMMADGVGLQRRLAVYALRDRGYDMEDHLRIEITKEIEQDKAVEIFVYAVIE